MIVAIWWTAASAAMFFAIDGVGPMPVKVLPWERHIQVFFRLTIVCIKRSNLHIDFNRGHPESILGGWQSVAQNIPSSNHLVQHLDRWLGCEGWSKPKIRLHLITHQVCIWSHQICIWSHQIGHILSQSFITDLGCHHLPDPCIVAPLLNRFWQLSSVLPTGGKVIWNLLFRYIWRPGWCIAWPQLDSSTLTRADQTYLLTTTTFLKRTRSTMCLVTWSRNTQSNIHPFQPIYV